MPNRKCHPKHLNGAWTGLRRHFLDFDTGGEDVPFNFQVEFFPPEEDQPHLSQTQLYGNEEDHADHEPDRSDPESAIGSSSNKHAPAGTSRASQPYPRSSPKTLTSLNIQIALPIPPQL